MKEFTHFYEPGIPGFGLYCNILNEFLFWYWIEYRDYDFQTHKTLVWKYNVFEIVENPYD